MKRSDITAFITKSQLIAGPLPEIARGNARHVKEWMKEAMQDHGLIDHRDQLTEVGKAALANR